jgi:hypothetical protein
MKDVRPRRNAVTFCRWVMIAEKMPGRSEAAIKSHWRKIGLSKVRDPAPNPLSNMLFNLLRRPFLLLAPSVTFSLHELKPLKVSTIRDLRSCPSNPLFHLLRNPVLLLAPLACFIPLVCSVNPLIKSLFDSRH